MVNMNHTEQEIIKKYVRKNKQDRILWELSTPRKRDAVFWNFSGTDIFNENCLHPIKYMQKEEMEKYLFKLSGTSEVYFIGESYIGYLPLNQATERASMGEICIIYCGKGIGYYQGEQEIGKPPRFLLMQK